MSTDQRTPVDNRTHREFCELRLLGASITAIRSVLDLTSRHAFEIARRSCCGRDDMIWIDRRAQVRDCMCCKVPFVSSHAGHRLCADCSTGDATRSVEDNQDSGPGDLVDDLIDDFGFGEATA